MPNAQRYFESECRSGFSSFQPSSRLAKVEMPLRKQQDPSGSYRAVPAFPLQTVALISPFAISP